MSRPLRIQYPDAWCHVMNRGRHGEKIFETKEDYWSFVDLLEEIGEVFNPQISQIKRINLIIVKVAAYCLMSSHYKIFEE